LAFTSAESFENASPAWTKDELKRARDMYAAGQFYGEIDKALRRRSGSTKRRLEGVG
jgi:hypothetical protein